MSKSSKVQVTPEQLRELTVFRNTHTLGKLALFIAIIGALGVIAWTYESAWIRWPAYIGLGYMWMSMVTFMHDATHNTLFPKRWQNWAFGIIAMVPLIITFTAFKHDHLEHHRYNRTYKDPDAFTMGKRGVIDFIGFYAYALAGVVLTIVFFIFIYPVLHFDRRLWAVQIGELALKAVCYTVLLVWAHDQGLMKEVLELWFYPIIAFSFFNSMRFLSEHYETPWNAGKLAGTRTVISNPLHSFFWNNINYHAVHHLYPRVQYCHLVKLHRLLEPELLAQGAIVDKSYLATYAKALWRGPESEARLAGLLARRRSAAVTGGLGATPVA